MSPRAAATFSFLLAIPIIGGGGLLEVIQLWKESAEATGQAATPISHLLIGAAVAFVVGLASLALLVRWLEKGKLQRFAWWCIPVGILVVVWQLTSFN